MHDRVGPPTLAWLGTAGYESDGVNPDRGASGSTFMFKVKYTGPTPEYVRLHLLFNEEEVTNSPFAVHAGTGDPATGQSFYLGRVLSRAGAWSYRFSARGGGRDATGAPTTARAGPVLSPGLTWVSAEGYTTDGVNPDQGESGTRFMFKVRYTGPTPEYVRLHLLFNGEEVTNSPFAMHAGVGSPEKGQTFYLGRVLSRLGAWGYRFSAASGGQVATGAPTGLQSGPVVNSEGSVLVSGLACVPAGQGVQVSFTLSGGGAVTAEVLNVAGRVVRVLVAERELEGGVNSLVWDGRNAAGLTVPSGVYLVRVRARGEEGSQTQAISTVQLRR